VDGPQAHPPLTETELEILRLVATGATNREVGRARSISEATVKKHLSNINGKMGTANRTEAVRRALELGLVTVGSVPPGGTARDGEAARRLVTELERTRRRSRVLGAWLAGSAVLLAAAALVLAYAVTASRQAPPMTATAPPTPAGELPPWTVGVDLPRPLTAAAVATLPGEDAIYILAGRGPSGLSAAAFRYRSAELRWQDLADKPTPVEHASAVGLKGTLLVPGGCLADGTATAVVEVYHPAEDRWHRAADLPAPACGYGLAVLEGDVFLFGGRGGRAAETALGSVWRYRVDEDAWLDETTLPLPRSDLAAVTDGNRIRLLGGRDPGGRLQASHWIYRPFAAEHGRWDVDTGTPLPEGRGGLSALSTPFGVLLVVGGGWDRQLRHGTLILGRDGEWQPDAPLPGFTPQQGAGLVLADNRQAVLLGGEVDGKPLARHYRRQVVAGTIFVPAR